MFACVGVAARCGVKLDTHILTRPQFTLTSACVGAAALPHLWRMPWLLAIPIAALLVGRWWQRERGGTRIPAWIKLPLVLLFPILIIVHYGNIFGREPGSALACAMLVLKLLETEKRRDARAAVCFSAFVLMSAMLFDSSLLFTLVLLAALSLLLAALRELEPRPFDAPAQTRTVSEIDLDGHLDVRRTSRPAAFQPCL